MNKDITSNLILTILFLLGSSLANASEDLLPQAFFKFYEEKLKNYNVKFNYVYERDELFNDYVNASALLRHIQAGKSPDSYVPIDEKSFSTKYDANLDVNHARSNDKFKTEIRGKRGRSQRDSKYFFDGEYFLINHLNRSRWTKSNRASSLDVITLDKIFTNPLMAVMPTFQNPILFDENTFSSVLAKAEYSEKTKKLILVEKATARVLLGRRIEGQNQFEVHEARIAIKNKPKLLRLIRYKTNVSDFGKTNPDALPINKKYEIILSGYENNEFTVPFPSEIYIPVVSRFEAKYQYSKNEKEILNTTFPNLNLEEDVQLGAHKIKIDSISFNKALSDNSIVAPIGDNDVIYNYLTGHYEE